MEKEDPEGYDDIKLGISRCLLGDRVRYDGQHKRDPFLVDTLGLFVSYVPVCPEVECGLPVPRESMRLVGDPERPRLITAKTHKDLTDHMTSWCGRRLDELETENLCGFIFRKDSPSSGLYKVRVYNEAGMPGRTGTGIFARAFTERFPLIPVEEDGRLNDPRLREHFIEQIFSMKRWRELTAKKKGAGNIVKFHTKNKMLILSHSQDHYRRMGKLVASGKSVSLEELYQAYEQLFTAALKLRTTHKKHINVLMHIMGYFKNDLSADEKKELLEIMEQYRMELIPLIVPIILLNHYVRKYDKTYLKQQTYLNPHPLALKLRNHA
ncbi:MAG TPA: DUF523 and DUF1722 domain-containing protein [Desulfobacteraceae bacterium]|nr:DUF523 and DUF1722 domain-containing protein [Desulfobacteraceae bacterium]